jgi:hypothetical protein
LTDGFWNPWVDNAALVTWEYVNDSRDWPIVDTRSVVRRPFAFLQFILTVSNYLRCLGRFRRSFRFNVFEPLGRDSLFWRLVKADLSLSRHCFASPSLPSRDWSSLSASEPDHNDRFFIAGICCHCDYLSRESMHVDLDFNHRTGAALFKFRLTFCEPWFCIFCTGTDCAEAVRERLSPRWNEKFWKSSLVETDCVHGRKRLCRPINLDLAFAEANQLLNKNSKL